MLRRITSIHDLRGSRVLVFGAGGGGDALGAIHLYLKLKRIGAEPYLGSVVWERRAVDPIPGPISLDEMRNIEPLAPTLAWVTGESYALRGGKRLVPQVAKAAKVLGARTLFIDVTRGAEGAKDALRAAVEILGLQAVIGVDVGGDMLAKGYEEGLQSPLADAVSLYALINSGAEIRLIEILGPGSDGEIEKHVVLERIAEAARYGGLVEVTGLTREEYEAMVRWRGEFYSEASVMPLRAFSGETGEVLIRGGARRVHLDPVNAAAYIIEAEAASKVNKLYPLVEGTRSIWEARDRLNRAGVKTELDIEEEAAGSEGRPGQVHA